MPWKECHVMDERLRFVARLLEGETMVGLCEEFGISRKTGYKIWDRYRQEGVEALCDRSRRPVRYANQLPAQIERLIVETKRGKPHWGARKIRELLVRRLAGDVRIPAKSTVHAVLDRHGLVSQARKRQAANKAVGTELSHAVHPNDLWCADFKGEFKTGDGRYCYPLTVTDQASRMILLCEAPREHKGVPRHRGLCGPVQATRPAGCDPERQRLAFRQPQRSLQPVEAFGILAQARHRDRKDQARPSAAERPP
jgi:transposase